MLRSKITSYYETSERERICQGDLLINLDFVVSGEIKGALNDSKIDLQYAVVMTQDCDLSEDLKTRKFAEGTTPNLDKQLPSILLCPAYPSEKFITGVHIPEKQMNDFGGKKGQDKELNRIKSNTFYPRFHFLPKEEGKFPDLVVDFKHFYTIPSDLLYDKFEASYLMTVNELFRERLSQRFAGFLSRFGLPEIPAGASQNGE